MNCIKKTLSFALAAALSMCVFTACESNDNDDGNSDGGTTSSVSSSSVLPGTWYLVANDGSSWYIHFGQDGTWKITDDAAGSKRRVYGSYSTSGNTYKGDMTNPGVGSGTISGNILSDTEIDLDFCEHWHTPYKHVPYKGTKK